ncbi:unnamed protein product [Closterium sp. NIES-53]
MTSLRRSGGSGDGGGGGSGGGGGRPSGRCGAVRWGVSGGGQMRLQQHQRESLTPQQLREWYTSRGGGGGSSGSHSAAVPLGVPGGGLPHLQRRLRETLMPQQLREWYVQCGASRSGARCPYVIRTSDWAEFGDATELPRWLELVRQSVDIIALDDGANLCTMYALSVSVAGDCYWYVPPNPSIAAAALGASESGTLPGTAPAEALHTFTLDSGASRCFFRDSITLTPLPALVPVRLADPSEGLVMARSSTVLPCLAVPSGSLSGLLYELGSSLYTLATEPSHVAASAQVSASGQVAASCSCRLLSHQTLLWHHRLGHPSLPRLLGMHSRFLVSGLPRSLPPLARPNSLASRGGSAPLLTPPHFPRRLLPCRLSTWTGGEFSSNLLQDFCRGEGILQSFMLLNSPPQNGIAERRIGLVMELNLWPRVSLPETSPTLRWTGKVGDASVFRVWGSRAFVRNTSADNLSPRAIPCVFLGFVPDAPGWQFYHPTSRGVFSSQDVTFDKSVPFYRLFPYRSAPPPPPPLFLAPGPPPVHPLPPQGPSPSGVSQVDPLPGLAPV